MSLVDNHKDINHFLSGGGEMGERIRSFDWSATSLGPIDKWPQSLRTSLNLILTSYYPLFFWWGEDFIQFYNDAYIPVLGSKHPKSLGQVGKECWPEAWHLVTPMIELVKKGASTFNKNTLLPLQRNGYVEECYFDFAYSPIRNEAGEVAGIFAAVSETTEQVINERRLEVLAKLGRSMLEAKSVKAACELSLKVLSESPIDVPYGLLYLKEGDHYRLANSYGLEQHPAACPQVIDLSSASAAWDIQKVLHTQQPYLEENILAKLGPLPGTPWTDPSHAALLSPINLPTAQEPIGVFIAGISPGKKFNDAYSKFLELASGHIETAISNGKVYEEERLRLERLVELDEAKTNFFNNVSHEFRTPLTLMLAPLEEMLAASNKSSAPADQEQLRVVYQNALRLLKLVNSLLDFSRISAKRAQASYEPTDLCSFTSELASAFASVAQKAGLAYQVSCAPISVPVYIDPEMWEKIVFNLISNALKYTLEGQITVKLHETATHAQLSVQDTGVGIPSKELPNLFKRFHRIQNSRSRSHEGTGIGLALVKELVEQHGGTIEVSSVPDQGTTFTVSIPKGSAHLEQEKISAPKQAFSTAIKADAYVNEVALWNDTEEVSALPLSSNGAATAYNAGTNILIVDDNADMLRYLKRILSAYWQVTTAKDGVEALAVIRQKTPDLILSDVMMPRMNGFELLAAIRQDSTISHIPVILLSARAGEEATIEGLEKGANDYLIKPFSASELIARIKTQLELKYTQQDNAQLRKIEEELTIYKIIIDQAFDPLLLVREDGSFAYVNALALKRWGYTREEIDSLKVADIDPLYQQEEFEKVFALSQVKNIPPFETLHKRKDGSVFPVEVNLGGITINGKAHQIAVVRDITERKKAEEALSYQSYLMQSITDNATAGLFMMDINGICTFMNPAAEEISGYTFEEIKQHPHKPLHDWIHHLHPDGSPYPIATCPIDRALPENNDIRAHEDVFVHRDGTFYNVSCAARPIIKDGVPIGTLVEVRDITESKKTAEALARSEEHFRTFANNIQNLAWMANPDGFTYWYNQRWYEYTGTTSEEMKAWGWQNIVHPDHAERIAAHVIEAGLKNEGWEITIPLKGANGQYRWFLTRAYAVKDAAGKLLRWIGTNTDIQEQKTAEEELKKKNEELQKTNNDLDNFIYTASHDLKAPITNIEGLMDMLVRHLPQESRQIPIVSQVISMTQASINRFKNTIGDLTELTKLQRTVEDDISQVQLSEMLEEICLDLKTPIHETHAQLEVDFSQCAFVQFSRKNLRSIIYNLVSNAIKYHSPERRPVVRVSTELEPDYIILTVADNGLGMDLSKENKLFSMFKRLHDHVEGTGLGLYIVKKIVDNSGGRIEVESELGKGSIFKVYFRQK